MDGWFPRLSPDAKHVASGSNTIWLDGSALAAGIGPVWLSPYEFLFGSQTTGALMRYTLGGVAPNPVTGATGIGGNQIAAGGNRWAIFRTDPVRIILDNGTVVPGQGNPCISDDGSHFASVDYATGEILVDGIKLLFAGDNLNLRWGSQTLCWERFQRIYGITTPGQPVIDLTIPGLHQYKPVPVWTGKRLLVLSHTDTGVILQQWGQTTGWPVYDGETDGYQDARALDPDHVRVAFSVKGQLHDVVIDCTTATVDLTIQPDLPFSVLGGGVIADILPRLMANMTAAIPGIIWFNKNGDFTNWGAWLDYDAVNIGLLADSSTGQMLPNGQPDWMYFADTRVWLPRRAVTGWTANYPTRFVWANGTVTHETIALKVDVGSGRYAGVDVDLRHIYDPRRTDPKNPKRKTGYLEYSYYSVNGLERWEEWQDDENGIPRLRRAVQPIPLAAGSFVPPPRPMPYGPIIIQDIVMPALTIESYTPNSGVAPLTVTAVAKVTSGSFKTFTWLYRKQGDSAWKVAATNPSSDIDHHYVFDAGVWEIKLRGDGASGSAETGAVRRVAVQAKQIDPPPPPPVHTLPTTTFRCASGQYLTAELGGGPGELDGIVVANRNEAGPWETFQVEPRDGDRIAFKSSGGFYMSAQPNGTVFCNRQAAGAWETWEQVQVGDGAAFKLADTDRFLTAEAGGGGLVTCRTTGGDGSPQGWQTFQTDLGGGGASIIAGRIRAQGRLLFNDAGVFRPRFDMWGAALAVQDYMPRLQWSKRWGFNGGRVFVGSLDWAGMTAAQACEAFRGFLDATLKLGLYVEATLVTNSGVEGYDVRAHVAACIDIAQQYPHVVIEIANEPYHQTQNGDVHNYSYLAGLADLASTAGLCVALGTTNDDEDANPASAYGYGNSYVTRHLNRGMASLGRDRWNMIRRVRELEAASETLNRFVWNDEPIGAGPVEIPEKRLTDPAVFFCCGLLNRGFEIGGTFMNDSGLNCHLPSDPEVECAQSFVQGSTCVPFDDVLTFKNTGWGDSPVRAANFDSSIVRAYSFVAGHRGLLALIGVAGDPGLQFQNGWGLGQLLAERTGQDGKKVQAYLINA